MAQLTDALKIVANYDRKFPERPYMHANLIRYCFMMFVNDELFFLDLNNDVTKAQRFYLGNLISTGDAAFKSVALQMISLMLAKVNNMELGDIIQEEAFEVMYPMMLKSFYLTQFKVKGRLDKLQEEQYEDLRKQDEFAQGMEQTKFEFTQKIFALSKSMVEQVRE